jgi:hypothetical protein
VGKSLQGVVGIACATAFVAMGCLLTTSLDGIVGTKPLAFVDGGLDAFVSDAHESDVSQADAPVDSSPGTGYCAKQKHAFCADFDESNSPSVGWTAKIGTGSIDVDTTTSVSAPASIRLSAPADCTVLAKKAIGLSAVRKLHYNVDIQSKVTSADYVTITSLTPGMLYQEFLILAADRSLFYTEDQFTSDGGLLGYQSTFTNAALVPGTWTHLTLDITLGSPSTVTVSVDGVQKLSKTTNTIASDQPLDLQVGGCISANQNGGTLLFDNVTLDLEY